MIDQVYEKLVPALNARSTFYPAIKCKEFFDLVSYLYTQEEAAIAVAMPLGFCSLEAIAENLPGSDPDILAGQLEAMGDKGLLHIREVAGKKVYELLPIVPGMLEFQLMKGIVDEHNKTIAVLLNNYSKAVKNMFLSSSPPQIEAAAPGRKVTINQEIANMMTIVPYNEARELVENTEFISAGTCLCRHQGALLGRPCQKPANNCMIFGETAKFAAERGFAQKLTRMEALQRLDAAEKHGLVHCYTDSPEHFVNVLCNCCSCHCMTLRGVKKSPVPSQAVIARYLIQVDNDACTGCEACIERCQMGALKMQEDKLVRDAKRCIGCGICMFVCPANALTLEPREAGKISLKT